MKKIGLILLLLLITYSLTIIETPIKKINETRIGERVRVRGEVLAALNPERITILNLSDETGSIKTVFFDEITAWKGMKAEITGRITDYQGEKELKGVRLKLLE